MGIRGSAAGHTALVRSFTCPTCGQLVFYENSQCLRCGCTLGYLPDDRELVGLTDGGDGVFAASAGPPGRRYRRCGHLDRAACNWMVDRGDPDPLCASCRLTRVRANDADEDGLAAWLDAEVAKRRLLFQLGELGLPVVSRQDDPARGLAFDFLSSRFDSVTTGHAGGVITLDLSESDDAYREGVRVDLGEPYRTVLGHLRHEIGHYYWPWLVERAGHLDAFRARFGDERLDYGKALDRHYGEGPPGDWPDRYVSSYATMHPWEDWAETFAHYLHIRDTLQTAAAFGIEVHGPVVDADPAEVDGDEDIATILAEWLPLTYALNAVERSMGKDDLYPFVLAPEVVAKLGFVHEMAGTPVVRQPG